MGLTSVAVCGVVPVAAMYSADIVAWRIYTDRVWRDRRWTSIKWYCGGSMYVCTFCEAPYLTSSMYRTQIEAGSESVVCRLTPTNNY